MKITVRCPFVHYDTLYSWILSKKSTVSLIEKISMCCVYVPSRQWVKTKRNIMKPVKY